MRAISKGAAGVRHVFAAGVEGILAATILALVVTAFAPVYTPADWLAGDADAARGANRIELVGSSTARLAASYGETVTTRSSLARDYYLVYVRVVCHQDGRATYEKWQNIKTGDWTTDGLASFALSGQSWAGGGADCRADLLNAAMKGGHRVYQALASVGFAVAG